MNNTIRMQFSDSPAPLGQYLRAAFARGSGRQEMPAVQAVLSGVQPAVNKVAAYARVCGFDPAATTLPLTYPHILAFPLHMELMLRKDFPLPLMGLVHIRNRITCLRPLPLTERLDIRCWLGEQRVTEAGREFDIHTEVSRGGEVCWLEVSTNLCRQKRSSSQRRSSEQQRFACQESWSLAGNLGRRYARVSGDSNPIHLWPLTARLFGFRRHIAHGMWSKARIAAALSGQLNSTRCCLEVEFRRPLFLPARAVLHYSADKDGYRFEMRSADGDQLHLRGSLMPVQ